MPLPYVLASLAFSASPQAPALNSAPDSALDRLRAAVSEDEAPADVSSTPQPSALLVACILASSTLLLTAVLAKLRFNDRTLDRRKAKFGDKMASMAALGQIKQIATTALSVGLPFYVAAQLGGVRAGLVLLAATACGLCSGPASHAAPRPILTVWRMIREKKLLCAYLGLGILYDILSLSTRMSLWQLLSGYLALATIVFALPPPMPITIHTAPPPAQTNGITRGLSPLIESPDKVPSILSTTSTTASPLVLSKEDVRSTFISGALLSIFTILFCSTFQSTPSFTASSTIFTILSVVSAASFYFFAKPSALRFPCKAGVAAGCTSAVAAGLILHSNSWITALSDALFSGLAYFTVSREAGLASASHHHDHDHNHKSHHHHHHAHAPHAHDKHSRITGFLLKHVETGGLVHSILVEKDSRRIAYFGWFVCLQCSFCFGYFLLTDI